MKIPKECINSNCNNIIYVEKHNLHLPLQCQSCIDNKGKTERIKYLYIRLEIRDGEREYTYHCLDITKAENINFVGQRYASKFWGESYLSDGSWYAWNGEIAITLKKVVEITEEHYNLLNKLMYDSRRIFK